MSSKESFRCEEEWRERTLVRCLAAKHVSVAFPSPDIARRARYRFYPTRNRLALINPDFLHIEIKLHANSISLTYRPPATPV